MQSLLFRFSYKRKKGNYSEVRSFHFQTLDIRHNLGEKEPS